MRRTMMKSKIHRATVTGSDLDYVGSITLDPALMKQADVLEHPDRHERVAAAGDVRAAVPRLEYGERAQSDYLWQTASPKAH